MKRWLTTPLIVATIALIAAGCGADDDQATSELAALRAELAQTRAITTEALVVSRGRGGTR